MKMIMLTTEQSDTWKGVLERCVSCDFYHLPQYHKMAEDAGEGKAYLFVYSEDGYQIALPLLIRTLDGYLNLRSTWKDATSVYGYPGPIASHALVPTAIVARFQMSLEERLKELEVVTVFSRLNALLPQRSLLEGVGECRTLIKTVSIDLSLPLDEQRVRYRKNHKEGINKLRREGVICTQDLDGKYLDEFVDIYYETMQRVEARPEFFFPPSYFKQLMADTEGRTSLFVCLHEGRVVCGGLFLECCGILQCHLAGTRNESLKKAPMKLLIDGVRVWATQQKYRCLHLGGGVTSSPDDRLLHFKLGFSDQMHDFTVWSWILMPHAYRQLCAEKTRWNQFLGLQPAHSTFFPEYRCPTMVSTAITPIDDAVDHPLEAVPLAAPEYYRSSPDRWQMSRRLCLTSLDSNDNEIDR